MRSVFDYLVPAMLAIVLGILALGIYALFRGGDFGRSYSNKLMRARVAAQFLAVVVIMAAVWWRQHAGH